MVFQLKPYVWEINYILSYNKRRHFIPKNKLNVMEVTIRQTYIVLHEPQKSK